MSSAGCRTPHPLGKSSIYTSTTTDPATGARFEAGRDGKKRAIEAI
jgi:hypothetical protein